MAEEDRWNKTSYYLDPFFTIDSIGRKEGHDLPYYFHDGESTLPSNDNLIDAVMLNTRRIGHGIDLFRFPMLELAVKKKQIALEVCPLSNQILGYVPDLRMHPASGYIKRNIPITLNTDDPQIFNYNGLTYDFWTAFMAALKYFNRKWDEFIEEFGPVNFQSIEDIDFCFNIYCFAGISNINPSSIESIKVSIRCIFFSH